MSTDANNTIAILLGELSSTDANLRNEAAEGLGKLEKSSSDVVLALERAVANDLDQAV